MTGLRILLAPKGDRREKEMEMGGKHGRKSQYVCVMNTSTAGPVMNVILCSKASSLNVTEWGIRNRLDGEKK